jgi:hypothetical protein
MSHHILPSLAGLRIVQDDASTEGKRKRTEGPSTADLKFIATHFKDDVLTEPIITARHLWNIENKRFLFTIGMSTGLDTESNPLLVLVYETDSSDLIEFEMTSIGGVVSTSYIKIHMGDESVRVNGIDSSFTRVHGDDSNDLVYRLDGDNPDRCTELPAVTFLPVVMYDADRALRTVEILRREGESAVVTRFNEFDAQYSKYGGLYHPLNRFAMFPDLGDGTGRRVMVPLAEPIGDDELPPGWEERRNATGDVEFFYEGMGIRPSKHTYTKANAWRFFRSGHGRQFGDLETLRRMAVSVDVVDDASESSASGWADSCDGPDGARGAYGSLSKRFHRERVVRRMIADVCATRHASVVFLGSPDMADAAYFQSTVDDGTLPSTVSFHSVNRDAFTGDGERYPNVSFHPGTGLLEFLETQPKNAHTLVWMDLTSTDATYRELAAACHTARETVMLVLSLRAQTMQTTTPVVETVSAAMGTSITHIENYQGLSGTRNMAFYEIDCSTYRHREYRDEFDSIGMLVYTTPPDTTTTADEYTLVCKTVSYVMNMCLDYDTSSSLFTILPYDTTRRLKDRRSARRVPASNIASTARHTKRYLDGRC